MALALGKCLDVRDNMQIRITLPTVKKTAKVVQLLIDTKKQLKIYCC